MSQAHHHLATVHSQSSKSERDEANPDLQAYSNVPSCLSALYYIEIDVPFQSHFGMFLRISLNNDCFPSCILVLSTLEDTFIRQCPL